MTIKPVASSFDVFNKPSPFSNRPRASAQDEKPKPTADLPSPTSARPVPAANSRKLQPIADYAPDASNVKPVASTVKPVPAAAVDSSNATDEFIPQASADVVTPVANSAKPRVSVKA